MGIKLGQRIIDKIRGKNQHKNHLENKGERIFIDANDLNYEKFDMYQKNHFKRYDFAKTFLNQSDIVGDFACGTGYGSVLMSKQSTKVIGCDINEKVVNAISKKYRDNEKVSFICNNLLNLEFENHFDKLVSFETVEHLNEENISQMFKIFSKALKENGMFIFSVPYMQEASEVALKMGHHKTFDIDENKISNWLNMAGLEMKEIFYQNYQTHDLSKDLEHKDFIVCVAQKVLAN